MFNPENHPLLSARAVALQPPERTAYARHAERLLGLSPDLFDALTPAQQECWADAVVCQINYTLDRSEVLVQESMADRQLSYRRDGERVSPTALALVDANLNGLPGIAGGTHWTAITNDG